MKLNLFKIDLNRVEAFKNELYLMDYKSVASFGKQGYSMTLFLLKKGSENRGWIDYYKGIITEDDYKKYSSNWRNETVAGVYLVENEQCCFAVTHGQAHFIVRNYCEREFGLDLAERIVDCTGLKMKHSQTFTSNGKKDITSYTHKRKVDGSFDYGEAFNYVKCKTIDKNSWGETADFGESVRFTSGKYLPINADNIFELVDRVQLVMKTDATIKLPRYWNVKDETIIKELNAKLIDHFDEYVSGLVVDDYWMTGVSFSFSSEFRYALKFKNKELTSICDSVSDGMLKKAIADNKDLILKQYPSIWVLMYDENDVFQSKERLLNLIRVTIEHNSKNYVLFSGEWVEFSDSYIRYIEDQVDNIAFEIKDSFGLSETGLINRMVLNGYRQLHCDNIHIGKYCIEKADLMDDEYVIMIKDQHNQSDLVYLIKQATTSIRLADSNELNENIFNGRKVCLWMLVNRKELKKLSDFKSFHLLDALCDFKKEVTEKGLDPVIWVSLNK